MLERYRSLPEVLAADPKEVQRVAGSVDGVGQIVGNVRSAMLRCLEADIASRPVLSTYTATIDFLRALLAFGPTERVAVLFLDGANGLLAAEIVAEGTVDQVALYPREICKRALEVGAAAFIVGHNHPGGGLDPSKDDRALTEALARGALALSITFHDHIIVSRKGWRSMREMGVL